MKARCCTCAPAGSARPGDRAAPCRDDEHHDAGDPASAAPRARRRFRAGRPPARPAPARISATPGSSATPPISSPASGSAMTTIRRPRRRPAAACRSKSGPASCARPIRACRWRPAEVASGAAVSVELVPDGLASQCAAALAAAQAPVPLAPIPVRQRLSPPPARASAPPNHRRGRKRRRDWMAG